MNESMTVGPFSWYITYITGCSYRPFARTTKLSPTFSGWFLDLESAILGTCSIASLSLFKLTLKLSILPVLGSGVLLVTFLHN